MAPEQVRGQEVDARCDLFALGAILYEMVSGHRAFPGDSAADVLSLILKESPKELSQSGVAVTPTMERILFRCLEKEKQDRFQTARDLCFALEAIATASSSGTIAVQELKPHGKSRLVVASLAVIAVAAAASFLAGRHMAEGRLGASADLQPTDVSTRDNSFGRVFWGRRDGCVFGRMERGGERSLYNERKDPGVALPRQRSSQCPGSVAFR
ncbi:MAG: hypothetical protein DMG76_24670 [Acidobacteria bacterium]|nr:MAG: hypothetical protein DMG76_24670 [Acidobacteriota bacterium]